MQTISTNFNKDSSSSLADISKTSAGNGHDTPAIATKPSAMQGEDDGNSTDDSQELNVEVYKGEDNKKQPPIILNGESLGTLWEQVAAGHSSNFLVSSSASSNEDNNMSHICLTEEGLQTAQLCDQQQVNKGASSSAIVASKKINKKNEAASPISVIDIDLQLIEECFQLSKGQPSSSSSPATTSNASNNPVYAITASAYLADSKEDQIASSTVLNPQFASTKVDKIEDRPGASPLLVTPKVNGHHSNSLLTFPQLPYGMTKFFPTSIGGNMNEFEKVISGWGWYTLDGVQLPCVFRDTQRFAAVHIVQMKLLSKFPPNIPHEVAERHVMVSHRMLPTEAWILNIVNASVCQYELGCQIFTPNDELVDVDSVEHFYWVVKDIHLSNLAKFYENELKNVGKGNVVLQASITRLKLLIEAEIMKTKKQVRQLSMTNMKSAFPSINTVQPSVSSNITTTSVPNPM